MLTFTNNKDKLIKIEFSQKNIVAHNDTDANSIGKKIMYQIELPTISCNKMEDAEYIKQQVNTFVQKLCNKCVQNND